MKALKYLTILVAVALIQGCAKRAIVEQPAPQLPDRDDPVGPPTTTKPYMDGVVIVDDNGQPISQWKLEGYLGGAVQNYGFGSARLSLAVNRIGDGYGGYVRVSFIEDGGISEVYQQTKDPRAGSISSKDTLHNIWFEKSGKRYWHGFFQDRVGAVVIVIDGEASGGTGDNPYDRRLSGQIWYKNFNKSWPNYSEQGYLPCWVIDVGPYDCRTFVTKRSGPFSEVEINNPTTQYAVSTTSAVYPNTTIVSTKFGQVRIGDYIKLGNFSGLSELESFGN
jgi:hypothetical protein